MNERSYAKEILGMNQKEVTQIAEMTLDIIKNQTLKIGRFEVKNND